MSDNGSDGPPEKQAASDVLEGQRPESGSGSVSPDEVEIALQVFRHIRGPVPPAEEMRGYALADPGLPEKILQDVETRRDQRHQLTARQMRMRHIEHLVGQASSTFLAVAGFAAAIFNQWLNEGPTWLSIFLALAGVGSNRVAAIVHGKKKSKGDSSQAS